MVESELASGGGGGRGEPGSSGGGAPVGDDQRPVAEHVDRAGGVADPSDAGIRVDVHPDLTIRAFDRTDDDERAYRNAILRYYEGRFGGSGGSAGCAIRA